MNEVERKLVFLRDVLAGEGLGAIRLRGVDYFSWATGGASSVVILTSEAGAGEVLVTARGAWVLTDAIEEPRFRDEEIRAPLGLWANPWQEPARREAFVADAAGGGAVASDRPAPGERPLPDAVRRAKRVLTEEERERYRRLGADAARAMTEVLRQARPDWTERELAGAGARALWARGIHPTLTLAAGEERLPRYRHPVPTESPLGSKAMLVFCGRRHGLYANLTRFVFFRAPTAGERRLRDACAAVEAEAWRLSVPGARLGAVYAGVAARYGELGFPGEPARHHQGGTTGYLAREVVARPDSTEILDEATAVAWNPSLPGLKIEDTAVAGGSGIEILTGDPRWPAFEWEGRSRPDFLIQP